MKKVVSITLNTFINDNRVLKEVRSLHKAGLDVTVSCLELNGEPLEENHKEFKVRRIHIRARALPRGRFFGAIKYAELLVKTLWRYRDFDIWHCNDFEPLIMASILKLFKKKLLVVYDAHEYAREKNGLGNLEKYLVKKWEPRLIGFANEVITVSEGIAEEYQRLYGLEKVHVVYNAPHQVSKFDKENSFRERFDISAEKTIFLYQGKLTQGRGVQLLIDAFSLLGDSSAELVFMGNGDLQHLAERASQNYSNVHLHPQVSYEEIIRHTSSADFGLLTVENICLSYYFCMPNKMFEYMQAGIPILTTNLHDCRMMVEREKLGVVIPEFTAESFAETIRQACDIEKTQFGEGLKRCASQFHWGIEEKKLIEIYKGL